MIKLLTFPPAFGLFASSPFCVKAAYMLNRSGQAWQREDMTDPRKMPFGKLPAIRTDGRVIADSDNIRAYLEAQGNDFDAGLSDNDRADARAYARMVEEHIYFHIVLDRWADDTIWPTVRETYFAGMPGVLRPLIAAQVRKKVVQGLHQQGLGRFSRSDRLERIKPDLDAITARLSQAPFLFGAQPTSADMTTGPMLAAAVATPGDTPLKAVIFSNDALIKYIARVEDACG